MVPAAILTVIAVGMVMAYVLPQRMQARADYAAAPLDGRYSQHLRVVKSTARRVERAQRPSTSTAPLHVNGEHRARILSMSASTMSRPAGPLDKAATAVQREYLTMSAQRRQVLAKRRVHARRRGAIAAVTLLGSIATWIAVAATAFPVIVATLISAVFASVTVAGARISHLQREADQHRAAVERRVTQAATATQALQRVAKERAVGLATEPSDAETQAIRVLTAEDFAPAAAPADLPGTELPGRTSEPWTPAQVPAPAYTLKTDAKRRTARPLNEADFAQADAAARAALEPQGPDASSPEPAPSSLDAILSRRRRASA